MMFKNAAQETRLGHQRGVRRMGRWGSWRPQVESLERRMLLTSVIDLGTLGGNGTHAGSFGNRSGQAGIINNSGQVVGSSTTASGAFHAFLYSGGRMADLGTLGGTDSSASGINNSGQVVGTSATASGGSHAFLYSGGRMADLGTLGGITSSAYGINDAGQVIGSWQTASDAPYHAFLYSGGKMVDLGTLGGTNSFPNGINDAGQVVGSSTTASGASHAFLYSGGRMADLGTLGGTDSSASGINDAGQVFGSSTTASGASHAFLYSGGRMADLGTLGGTDSSASGINNSGQVVGTSATASGGSHAFLYSGGSMADLGTLGGSNYSTAYGINDAGQVVGGSAQSAGQGPPDTFLYSGGKLTSLFTLYLADAGWTSTSIPAAINNTGQIVGNGFGSRTGAAHAFLINLNQAYVYTQFESTSGLHKLLYAGQKLAVSVSATNQLSQEVKGQETFYLSTNHTTSVQGDTLLTANGIVSLDLQGGQFQSLPQVASVLNVVIPSTIQPGTYYLKAVFAEIGDASANTAAVSPALTVCVNSKGQASSFADSQNAAVFDNAVNVVKQGNPPIPRIKSIQDIQAFVQGQEGLSLKVYNDKGNPAIGYGSDLKNSNGVVNSTFKSIIEAYIAAQLKMNPSFPYTFADYLDYGSGATINKATANALFQSGFATAQSYVSNNYSGLTLNQQAALIDIAYNVGVAGLAGFPSMNDAIGLGTSYGFACAGLELINSKRTSQIPLARTLADFYLLTSAPGVAEQL